MKSKINKSITSWLCHYDVINIYEIVHWSRLLFGFYQTYKLVLRTLEVELWRSNFSGIFLSWLIQDQWLVDQSETKSLLRNNIMDMIYIT